MLAMLKLKFTKQLRDQYFILKWSTGKLIFENFLGALSDFDTFSQVYQGDQHPLDDTMGNSCSAFEYDEIVAVTNLRTCREHCADAAIFVDGRTAEESSSDCRSSNLLKHEESNCTGLIQPSSAVNGSIHQDFLTGFHFPHSDSLLMMKPPLVGLLNQTAARSPLPISDGKAMSLTPAERGRFHQGNESEFTKKPAELQLYIVTWNMKGRLQETQKNLSLLLDLDGEKHDLYVIGLQEAPNFSGEEAIGKLLGDMYYCVGLSSMISLQLYVFARKSLRSNITGTMVDTVGLGGLGYINGRQKGAAAVLLGYNNLSLLFITSHLAAHEGNMMERNYQFERICQSVFTKANGLSSYEKHLQSAEPQQKVRHAHNFVEESDVVVWLGDLNYRVEMPRSSVGFLISQNLEEILWTRDQLHRAILRGEAFTGFSEGPLLFPPTYKFYVGTDKYSKERTPSWTDRILYKVKSTCSVEADLMLYNSISVMKTSDHKPVKAHLTLKNLLRTSS